MAETVRKKAAKKASGKKRGRPKKKNVTQTTRHLERAAAMVAADTGLPYDDALQKVTADYEARKAQTQPKRSPGRPRKDAGHRMDVMGLATHLTLSRPPLQLQGRSHSGRRTPSSVTLAKVRPSTSTMESC